MQVFWEVDELGAGIGIYLVFEASLSCTLLIPELCWFHIILQYKTLKITLTNVWRMGYCRASVEGRLVTKPLPSGGQERVMAETSDREGKVVRNGNTEDII